MLDTGNQFERLPLEIQQYVLEFDPTHREKFDRVVNEMKTLLSTLQELEFKPKYQKFFGQASYAHVTCATYGGNYRLASVEMQNDYFSNSIEFTAQKVLLYMKLGRSNHDDDDFTAFHARQWDIHDRHLEETVHTF